VRVHPTTDPAPEARRRTGARRAAVLVPLLIVLGVAACGYSAGPLVPEGVKTIAVPVFDNDTFRREIEVELTRAVAEELTTRTSLRVVGDPDAADMVVRGRIAVFSERVLADRERNEVTESSVVVEIVVVLENRAAGTTRSVTLTTREPYSTIKGQSLASARAEAFENLAEKVVHSLENDWPDAPDREPS